MGFTFPRSTCEPRQKHPPEQPFSFWTNIASIMMLCVYFVMIIWRTISQNYDNKKVSANIVLAITFSTFIAFQAWHAFSHYKSFEKAPLVQPYGSHFWTYAIAISSFVLLSKLTRYPPFTDMFYGYLTIVIAVFVDVFFVFGSGPSIAMVFSGLGVLAAIFLAFYSYMPKEVKPVFFAALFFFGLVLLFEINEIFFCENMQSYRSWPYHILLESAGLVAFTFLAYTLYKWTFLAFF